MTKQELARERNWQKARLMGLTFNRTVLCEAEKLEVEKIKQAVNNILSNWDIGTKLVGLNPTGTKKCCVCWMKRKLPDGHICRECIKSGIEPIK